MFFFWPFEIKKIILHEPGEWSAGILARKRAQHAQVALNFFRAYALMRARMPALPCVLRHSQLPGGLSPELSGLAGTLKLSNGSGRDGSNAGKSVTRYFTIASLFDLIPSTMHFASS